MKAMYPKYHAVQISFDKTIRLYNLDGQLYQIMSNKNFLCIYYTVYMFNSLRNWYILFHKFIELDLCQKLFRSQKLNKLVVSS